MRARPWLTALRAALVQCCYRLERFSSCEDGGSWEKVRASVTKNQGGWRQGSNDWLRAWRGFPAGDEPWR